MNTPTVTIPDCVLFDLDGTLLDTAPDMARALNRLRQESGLSELSFERIRPMVSHGPKGLLGLGFDLAPEDPDYPDLRRRFLTLYGADIASETKLFPGMDTVLTWLEKGGIPWGVVTNKPGNLTQSLLKHLQLWGRAACVVGGDTIAKRKPDPEPLLHACWLLGVEPARSFYIGDAERDIQAGKRAGMITLVARFGYPHASDEPETWGADGIIDAPENLLGWLDIQPEPTTDRSVASTQQTISVPGYHDGQSLFCIENTTRHE